MPEFITEAHQQFRILLEQALADKNNQHQMIKYLDSLTAVDDLFSYRVGRDSSREATGFVWQTGVMRNDFKLHGSCLFIDRMGRPITKCGWPNLTTAMLDGEKKLCLASEAITIEEHVVAP